VPKVVFVITLFILLISNIAAQPSLQVAETYDLPVQLKSVSAIHYVAGGKLACLADDIGSIFMIDAETQKMEKEIPFGPPGDYEGIAVVNGNAYIACADGRILEITNFSEEERTVTEHGTHLTKDEHLSGLCYDKRNKRLLVSATGDENANGNYKAIYSFLLSDKRMPVKPAIKIDLRSRVFNKQQPKRLQMMFQPSDLDINPVNGLLYVIDGTRSQLLRMRLSENIRDLSELDKEKFIQPEGITFTPSGELYIASKGLRDEPGILLRVRTK
jgi:uncharacterized protein YjiK